MSRYLNSSLGDVESERARDAHAAAQWTRKVTGGLGGHQPRRNDVLTKRVGIASRTCYF